MVGSMTVQYQWIYCMNWNMKDMVGLIKLLLRTEGTISYSVAELSINYK